MRLGKKRDDRNAATAQAPLHLGEMAEARDGGLPATGLLLAPRDRRQLAEKHLLDADRQVGLELSGKEVELGRAAFHEEDVHGPLDGGRPDAGHGQHAHRQVVGGHPEGRRPDDRIAQEAFADASGGAGGRRRCHEHAPPPPSLHVSALLEILDDAGHRVRVDPEESSQLPDAGECLVPQDAVVLDDVLELLRQLPADRDRAAGVDRQVHGPHPYDLNSTPDLFWPTVLFK